MFGNALGTTWKVLIVVVAALLMFGCSGEEVPLSNTGDDDDADVLLTQDEPGKFYVFSGIAGSPGLGGQGGHRTKAQHYWPQDIITVGDDVYIVDWNNHCVHKVTPDNIIERYIGSGYLGDDTDGPKELIDLNHPSGFTLGPDGMFYLSAWHNWKIKRIDPATGILSSPIGTGIGYGGDDGPASQAKFNLPSSAVFDNDGNMYIADQANQRLRFVDMTTMNVTTVAGNGTQGFADGFGQDVMFNNPIGSDATPGMRMDMDATKQNIYLADKLNNRIRKYNIATGEVTTIAGTGVAGYSGDGGLATNAQLHNPVDVHMTNAGVLYIADEQNHAIRRIMPNGVIETVVGNGLSGISEDGADVSDGQLHTPGGVYYDEARDILYIADTWNQQTRFIINP